MRTSIFIVLALGIASCGQSGAPAPSEPRAASQAGACPGFDPGLSASENAKRAGAFIDREDLQEADRSRILAELTATLEALPAFAPVHPCAYQLSADSPPDGSGVLQLTYELDGKAETVAAFYAKQFAGQGEVSSIVEDVPEGPTVHTVNLVSPKGNVDVNVQAFPPEDGEAPPLSVVLRTEGGPS